MILPDFIRVVAFYHLSSSYYQILLQSRSDNLDGVGGILQVAWPRPEKSPSSLQAMGIYNRRPGVNTLLPTLLMNLYIVADYPRKSSLVV